MVLIVFVCHFFVIFLVFCTIFIKHSEFCKTQAKWQKNDKKIEHPKSSKTWKNLVFCHFFVIFLSFHHVWIIFESFPFNFEWFLLYLFVIYLSLSLCFARFSLNIANFARHKQNHKKMTKKWQPEIRMTKKMTRANDKMNDKIIIFMSPSVWLQVSYKTKCRQYMEIHGLYGEFRLQGCTSNVVEKPTLWALHVNGRDPPAAQIPEDLKRTFPTDAVTKQPKLLHLLRKSFEKKTQRRNKKKRFFRNLVWNPKLFWHPHEWHPMTQCL